MYKHKPRRLMKDVHRVCQMVLLIHISVVDATGERFLSCMPELYKEMANFHGRANVRTTHPRISTMPHPSGVGALCATKPHRPDPIRD